MMLKALAARPACHKHRACDVMVSKDAFMVQTIMLISSDDSHTTELRIMLRHRRAVRFVGDAQRGVEAVALAAQSHPGVIIIEDDTPDSALLSLVEELHAVSPTSKVAVVGRSETLEQDTLLALRQLRVMSYVVWDDLDPALLSCWLALVGNGSLLVGSWAVLTEMVAPIERREGPRVAELILRTEERDEVHQRLLDESGPALHATLWQENQELTAILRTVFGLARVDLDVVTSRDALLVAVRRARDSDFVVIDCSYAMPDDMDRCASIVTETTIPVHIIHPNAATVDGIRSLAFGELVWLAPDQIGIPLLEKLRLLKSQAKFLPHRALENDLVERERDVLRLVADGLTDKEIARQVLMGGSTVRRIVAGIKHKVGLSSRRELIHYYRRSTMARADERRP